MVDVSAGRNYLELEEISEKAKGLNITLISYNHNPYYGKLRREAGMWRVGKRAVCQEKFMFVHVPAYRLMFIFM